MLRILALETDTPLPQPCADILARNGHGVSTVATTDDLLRQVREGGVELVLLGVMPLHDGLGLLARLKRCDGDLSVLALFPLAGNGARATFLQQGGTGWLPSPLEPEELACTVDRVAAERQRHRELAWLKSEHARTPLPPLVGQSRSVRIIRSLIETAAADSSPVLLEGEQGVGKALVARWIHGTSPRANRPFIRVICSGKSEIALDAELFGVEGSEDGAVPVQRGALELAQGGAVLLEDLDCVGQMLQERLSGVMKAGRFCRQGGVKPLVLDVRFMAASCHDLEQRTLDDTFDGGLYRQLKSTALHIPPLRERREDILPLIFHFIDQYNREFGRQVMGLSKLVERLLLEYPWPGNVREARNVIERAVILGGAELLYLEHLPLELFAKAAPVSPATFTCRLPAAGVDIEEVEKELIRQALDVSNNNQSKAARKLGLGIDAFRYRMKKHGFLK